jgi:hypothetical protein
VAWRWRAVRAQPGQRRLPGRGARPGLPARQQERTETADLSASFSEHGLLPQSRSFLRTVYRLEPGESFVSASFTLRSGPLVDRWRGWVSGSLAPRLAREEPARDIDLPEAALEVPGSAVLKLPEGVNVAAARLLLRSAAGGMPVLPEPGLPARLGGAVITARLEPRGLVLDASPEWRSAPDDAVGARPNPDHQGQAGQGFVTGHILRQPVLSFRGTDATVTGMRLIDSGNSDRLWRTLPGKIGAEMGVRLKSINWGIRHPAQPACADRRAEAFRPCAPARWQPNAPAKGLLGQ